MLNTQYMTRLLAGAACLVSVAAYAHPAEDLVKTTTQDVLTILKRDNKPGNEKLVRDQVTAKLLPYFDFTRMTALVVGKNWRSATPAQQASLTKEFKTLMIQTYSNVLTSTKVDNITVKPVQDPDTSTDVMVKTVVNRSGAAAIPVDYHMASNGSTWKVYDVIAEGRSIVTAQRSSYSQVVTQSGIDGLIKELASKNQQPQAKP
ncbi:MlaC/ttg2D family ABC transporter substrate-binding protein [Leeia oryzae]|uniref:MlaC/ttg2D family ABC transporter substrate-binding protein n=1 Tax=Leeia oryzae TaxID=356662 RepID=UPI000361318C|nr:ABC transporter substrate-binding protein [Leeia oryzae]